MSTGSIAHKGETERLLPRVAPFLAAMALGFLAVSMPLPALPLHVSRMGYGTAVAGLAVGLQALATILTRPSAGRMVDALGPKTTLLRGLVTASAAGWLYLASLLVQQPAPSLLVLLTGRLVLGAGESLLITGVPSWAIARAGSGRAGRAMAWNGIAQYGALALGAPVGFGLYEAFGFVSVAACTAFLPLLALPVIVPLAPTLPSGGTRMPLRSRRPCRGTGRQPDAGRDRLRRHLHLCIPRLHRTRLGRCGLCALRLRRLLRGRARRRERAARPVGRRPCRCRFHGRGGCRSTPALGRAVARCRAARRGATGAGCSLVFPSLGVEAFRRVPPEQRGIAVGIFAAFQDLAIGATGPILGTLAAESGSSAVFVVGALAAAAGAIAAARL